MIIDKGRSCCGSRVLTLLAYAFVLFGAPFNVLADEAGLYRQLSTANWGSENSIITYEYDDNGALIRKTTSGSDARVDAICLQPRQLHAPT